MDFKNKTVLITGASRGIGKEIALTLAENGANVVITGKSDVPNPKLEGTIFSVADEIIKKGGSALPLKIDVREEESVIEVIEKLLSILEVSIF